jgi:hypothetical protein
MSRRGPSRPSLLAAAGSERRVGSFEAALVDAAVSDVGRAGDEGIVARPRPKHETAQTSPLRKSKEDTVDTRKYVSTPEFHFLLGARPYSFK